MSSAYGVTALGAVLVAQFAPRSVFLAVKGVPIVLLIWSLTRAGVDRAHGGAWRVAGLVASLAGALVLEVSFTAGVAVFILAQAAYAMSVPWPHSVQSSWRNSRLAARFSR